MTALQSKYSGWLIHLTAWAVIFGMPLFVTSPDRPLMTGSEYLRFLLVPLSFMVVFYTNYFLLIERYLFTRQTGRFLGGNALLIAAVIVGLHLLFRYVLPPDAQHPPLPRPWQDSVRFFAGNAALYLLVVGAGVAIRMTGGWYKAEAARQSLQNLKASSTPFSVQYNNIYSLIQIDADRAQQAVHDLSRMLRYVLYESSCPTVPLAAEVEFLRDYIELMRIRLPRHVEVGVSLPEEPSPTPVAPLLFISLIENAFKHGTSNDRPSFIRIDIHERGGELVCCIRNSCFPKTASDRSGSHRAEKPLETAGDDLSTNATPSNTESGAAPTRRRCASNCTNNETELRDHRRRTAGRGADGGIRAQDTVPDAVRLVRQRLGGLRHAARPPVDLLFLRHPDAGAERHGTRGCSRRHARDLHHGFQPLRRRRLPRQRGRLPAQTDQLCRLPRSGEQGAGMVRTEKPCRNAPAGRSSAELFVKTEYRLRQIGFDSILYIEGLKDYVKIHVEEETHPVLTLTSLKSLEEQLPADRFVRVHRSFIVQPSKIRSIERNRIVFGKEYIPVSENYRQAFFDFLAEHSLLF